MWSLELHQINDLGCASRTFFALSLPASAQANSTARRVWLGGTALTAPALGQFCLRCPCDCPHGGPRVTAGLTKAGCVCLLSRSHTGKMVFDGQSVLVGGVCKPTPCPAMPVGSLRSKAKVQFCPRTGNSILSCGVGYLHGEPPTVGRWRCCDFFRGLFLREPFGVTSGSGSPGLGARVHLLPLARVRGRAALEDASVAFPFRLGRTVTSKLWLRRLSSCLCLKHPFFLL